MIPRPVEDYIADVATNHQRITEALAGNNRSAAIAALEGLVIQVGYLLDDYRDAFDGEQRQAIAARLLQAAIVVATPGAPNIDSDKNPNAFELDMLADSLAAARTMATAHGVEFNTSTAAADRLGCNLAL